MLTSQHSGHFAQLVVGHHLLELMCLVVVQLFKKNRMKHQHGKKWVPICQCAENICKNKLPVCFPLFFGLKGLMTIS